MSLTSGLMETRGAGLTILTVGIGGTPPFDGNGPGSTAEVGEGVFALREDFGVRFFGVPLGVRRCTSGELKEERLLGLETRVPSMDPLGDFKLS